MNPREKKMLDLLKKLKNEFGVVAVKAEFEAEGTRVDELLRLLELTFRSDLKLALKIGGCEAVRDLIESKTFGCDYIIAPMIESAYGLSKFIEAKEKIYKNSKNGTQFLFNLETKTCFDDIQSVIKLAKNNLDGCVFGRVDYTASKNMKPSKCGSRNKINSPKISNDVLKASKMSKNNGLDFVDGGGVSIDALPVLRKFKSSHLTRFETRKIVFSADALDIKNIDTGLLSAVEFELNWLKNKREYYKVIFDEDKLRIHMLESRWKSLIEGRKSNIRLAS